MTTLQGTSISKSYTVVSKQTARKKGRLARETLDSNLHKENSDLIAGHALTFLSENSHSSIHVYQSIEKNREVSTATLVDKLRASGYSVHVQALEPHFPMQSFEVILVPCLAVDDAGCRVGYGQGNYDRFLANQPQAIKLGLCFEAQRVDQIQAEDHDIRLDGVFTEAGLRYF